MLMGRAIACALPYHYEQRHETMLCRRAVQLEPLDLFAHNEWWMALGGGGEDCTRCVMMLGVCGVAGLTFRLSLGA